MKTYKTETCWVLSTVGDAMSTVGGNFKYCLEYCGVFITLGEYYDACGGYFEYCGGCSVLSEAHNQKP